MKINTEYPFKQEDLNGQNLFFITGPCVIESKEICLTIAKKLVELSQQYKVTIIFKASYDKANRTSASSFRGQGRDKGLEILQKVKTETGLPITTDIHVPDDAQPVAEVVDIIQTPAFLCRQTDLLSAASATGKYVNIKKGQFMAPKDMGYAIEKVGDKCLLTERGTFFGYNKLVVDFSGIHVLKSLNAPVVFDATHSVQNPGGGKGRSSGNRDLAVPLAHAAICQGVNGLFFEVHPNPEEALCDGENSLFLSDFEKYLPRFIELHKTIQQWK
jgi:2-dehydro-3-deoxyphosphooctonate aldolase (KDO 8-P synthase)